jgi:hypothetical protein
MQKSHMIPKPSRCRTHNCKTIVYGGHFCTLCSGSTFNLNPDPGPEIVVTYEHRAALEMPNLSTVKPAKALSPVGLAVVCLTIVFNLVAAYAQKHEDVRAEHSIVAD